MTLISRYANYHDTTYNPAGLWNFNGNKTDSSGNGLNLTLNSGTEVYSYLFPGLQGAFFDGSTKYNYATAPSSLTTTGDVTIEAIVSSNNPLALQTLLATNASAAASTSNTSYLIQSASSSSTIIKHQNGTQSDVSFTSTNALPIGAPYHIAVVRSSNVYTLYINGTPLGSNSGSLSAPTGGASGTLWIGGEASAASWKGMISSVKIITSALTSAQIKGEYNLTLGGIYGFV